MPRSIEMPVLYENINIKGALNIMEAARHQGVRKFVYASSSPVYGRDHLVLTKKEGQEGAYAAVIPKFIKQLLKDERSTIHGDGKQSWDLPTLRMLSRPT